MRSVIDLRRNGRGEYVKNENCRFTLNKNFSTNFETINQNFKGVQQNFETDNAFEPRFIHFTPLPSPRLHPTIEISGEQFASKIIKIILRVPKIVEKIQKIENRVPLS